MSSESGRLQSSSKIVLELGVLVAWEVALFRQKRGSIAQSRGQNRFLHKLLITREKITLSEGDGAQESSCSERGGVGFDPKLKVETLSHPPEWWCGLNFSDSNCRAGWFQADWIGQGRECKQLPKGESAFKLLVRTSRFMANVDRAYNHIRNELAQVGLLADGVYLDAVELCISHEKSGCGGERGYVFEYVGHYAKRGYRPGVIYLPRDLPYISHKPGHTLMDTIRHEYAHAWYYIDPSFFRQEWFELTFVLLTAMHLLIRIVRGEKS